MALLILFVMSALLLFSGCSGKQEDADEKADGKNEAGGTVTVTDMAGREVEVPEKIEKVYSVNSIGTIFLYTLKPCVLAGWNSELGTEKQYIKEEFTLPFSALIKGPIPSTWKNCGDSSDLIINMGYR